MLSDCLKFFLSYQTITPLVEKKSTITMPRTPRRPSRVRFNLPLGRQNTAYSDTSSSSHIRNISGDEIDVLDENFVADWLLSDGTPPARPYRMHVSEFEDSDRDSTCSSISSNVGPLPLQLLYGELEKLGQIPPNDPLPPVHRAEPQPSKLKRKGRFRSDFTHPDGTPISFHYSRAFFNDDEQEYIIPSSPIIEQPELHISVTKDWSSRKLSKQRDDQLLIYRVPKEHQLYFGMTVSEHRMCGVTLRKPEDDDDVIRVVRHGHPSWDIGFIDESWYLIGKNPHVVSSIYNRVVQLKPSLYMRMKRSFWRTFGSGVRSPALGGVLS